MHHLSKEIANAFDAKCDFDYQRRYPPTINEEESNRASKAAIDLVGKKNLISNHRPSMGSEDLPSCSKSARRLYMDRQRDREGSCMIHNPLYDFNDEILTLGASWWVKIAEQYLTPI